MSRSGHINSSVVIQMVIQNLKLVWIRLINMVNRHACGVRDIISEVRIKQSAANVYDYAGRELSTGPLVLLLVEIAMDQ